jgi:molybdenum cofactor cytidylyltransferase
MGNCAMILLAAGGSTRMGRPKQLLEFKGKKLITIVVERLLACRKFPVIVVLGELSKEIAPYCKLEGVSIIQNINWQSGMASTIQCGLEFAEFGFDDVSHVLFALCDQPFVEAEHYYALVEASEAHPDKIIAAYYGGQAGAPMIFPRSYFPMLARLTGDQGARAVVRNLQADVIQVSMPTAAMDWDEVGDVEYS